MAVRTLRYSNSLNRVWQELVYTEARLLADANAVDLADAVAELIARVEAVRQEQRTVWRDEIRAQAVVDASDDALDDEVAALSRTLLAQLKGDRKHVRYTRYFTEAPGAILRLGLESEIARVASWPASLLGDEDPAAKAAGEKLAATVEKGQKALGERTRAATARADHRLRSVVRLVDDVNSARLSLAGVLAQRAAKDGLGREWPDRFFRRGTRSAKASTDVIEDDGADE